MLVGRGEAAPRRGGREAGQFGGGPFRHHPAAARAGTWPQVDHVIRTANRVLVMLDDDQRVALGPQPLQGVEQRDVVARMQADGGSSST